RLDGGQERAITSACEQHAARLRASIDHTGDPAAANAAASRAWAAYLASRDRILRPDQAVRARTLMAAVMEHDMAGMSH
ncbi:MAG TPA: hypothetical protein VJT67_06545, partial [Longimicrobiaceae bacterium]|nr:hypothetical protein [Longimicrobiaceae bacterium]